MSSWIDVPVWQNLSAEGSASSCSKRFLTGVGFEPTHTLVYQDSRLRKFLTLAPYTARPSFLAYLDFFPYDMCFFKCVIFSIQRFNLLNGWCNAFEKIFVQTRVYFRVSHVFAGYLLFCAFLNCSAINHPMTLRVVSFLLLWTVILNWRSSMTEFVSWGLCLIVFKTFSDRSGNRTHVHTRVPEFSTEEFLEFLRPLSDRSALDRSAILPGLRRHISFWSVSFELSDVFNSEM